MNIVTVKINGVEYNLKGEEKEEYLHKVASYVDKKIKDIMSNNGKLSTSSVAVLAAVNTVYDLLKSQNEYEEILKQVEGYKVSEEKLKMELEETKKQMHHMKYENDDLQKKLQNSKNEAQTSKDEEIDKLLKQFKMMQETAKQQLKEGTDLKVENKELKFQVQSSKYKMIDLQNRLMENQIELAKAKKGKVGAPLAKRG